MLRLVKGTSIVLALAVGAVGATNVAAVDDVVHSTVNSVEEAQQRVGKSVESANFVQDGAGQFVAPTLGNSAGTYIEQASDGVSVVQGDSADGIGFQIPSGADAEVDKASSGSVVVSSQVEDEPSYVVESEADATQILAVIHDENSSQELTFEALGVTQIEVDALTGEAVLYRDIEGERVEVGKVTSPWAVDANGVEVPTHFEVVGNKLTQVVEHQSAEYAYPIVADPQWSWSELWEKIKDGMRKSGRYIWSGTKWVAGKGVVLARRTLPGAAVYCLVGGGWAWYRSDADGWVRVGDAAAGCLL